MSQILSISVNAGYSRRSIAVQTNLSKTIIVGCNILGVTGKIGGYTKTFFKKNWPDAYILYVCRIFIEIEKKYRQI